MIYSVKNHIPKVNKTCFIAQNSSIIGDVNINYNSSVWFGAVIRGDTENITIGQNTNIQDNCTVHMDKTFSITIGDYVTIGHNCIIHGCSIGNNCLIGMGTVILNGVHIGENCIIGAGSLITQNVNIPSGMLCFGSPVKVIRKLTQEEINSIRDNAVHYTELSKSYK